MGLISGIYTGLTYEFFPYTQQGAADCDQLLADKTAAQEENLIASVFMCPTAMITNSSQLQSLSVNVAGANPSIGGYAPRNKKLLCYPYNYLNIDCITDNKDYRYEWFDHNQDGTIDFKAYMALNPDPEISLVPLRYDGTNANDFRDGSSFANRLTLKGFPQCAYLIDSYAAWLSQKNVLSNSNSEYMTKAAENAVTGSSLSIKGFGGEKSISELAAPALENYANALASSKTGLGVMRRKHNVKGQADSCVIAGARAFTFYFRRMGITAENARMLDDFFDRFGYACNRLKVPNRSVRPYWTYTKTVECTIKGGVPVEYSSKICEIYNKGITFWKASAGSVDVGNYSQNNRPVAP